MPCLKILTNIPHKDIPNDFVTKIIPLLSKVLRKPENKFICVVSSNCHFTCCGDNTSPGAVATIETIGNVGPEDNKGITKEVTEFVTRELKIEPSRFFITFYDLKPYNVGLFGTTIE